MTKYIVCSLILISLNLIVTNSGLSQMNRAPLRIGMITSLSGPLKPLGTQTVNGLKLAVEHFKVNNPELASFIQLNINDDQSLPSKALEVTKNLIDSRSADVFIGPLTSTATLTVSPIIETSRKPLVTATETSILNNSNYFFRSPTADSYQAILLARFTFQKLGKKRVSIIFQKDSQYSKQMKEAYEQEFKRLGGVIANIEFFVGGVTDFSPILKAIKRKKSAAIFAPVFYDSVSQLVIQSKKSGLSIPFIGVTAWDSPSLYSNTSKIAIAGHYFPAYFSIDDPNEAIKEFVLSYRRRFGKAPDVYAALSYDAAMVIVEAYKKANTSRTTPFLNALTNLKEVTGLYPIISFDKHRNARRSMSIRKTTQSGSEFYDNIGFSIPTQN